MHLFDFCGKIFKAKMARGQSTKTKDEIENGKKVILNWLNIHSPSHVSFLLTGFLPELEHVFVPPLDLKNGHWRIALVSCREDILLFGGEKSKLKVPVKIEVSINGGPARVMDEISPPSPFSYPFRGLTPCGGSEKPKFYNIVIEEPIERIKIKAVIISENGGKKMKISDLDCPPPSEETISQPDFSLKKCRKRKAVPKSNPNLAQLSEVKMEFRFILKTAEQLEIENIDRQVKSLLDRKERLEVIAKQISERCQKCKQELKKE